METLISRYRNVSILVAVLFAQVIGLAVQVRRSPDGESTRLIRIWAVSAVTPLEKAIVSLQNGVGSLWHNYIYLRGVRQENRELKEEIQSLRLQQVRLIDDAEQARRLQLLLGFKEQFISRTVAAQVIGASGSPQSRAVYIDKGSRDGIAPDMAVVTADGIVGKVLRVFNSTSQVLLIDDQSSGVGAILEKSRLQGILRGTPSGEVVLEKIMADEDVQPGEAVLSSGGDEIFTKGLPVGVVTKVSRGKDGFLRIRVRPAVDLSKLEEVLVITQRDERAPEVTEKATRAADILAQRLPSVPDKPETPAPNQPVAGESAQSTPSHTASPQSTTAAATKPAATKAVSATAASENTATATHPAPKPAPSQSDAGGKTTAAPAGHVERPQPPSASPPQADSAPAEGKPE